MRIISFASYSPPPRSSWKPRCFLSSSPTSPLSPHSSERGSPLSPATLQFQSCILSGSCESWTVWQVLSHFYSSWKTVFLKGESKSDREKARDFQNRCLGVLTLQKAAGIDAAGLKACGNWSNVIRETIVAGSWATEWARGYFKGRSSQSVVDLTGK